MMMMIMMKIDDDACVYTVVMRYKKVVSYRYVIPS